MRITLIHNPGAGDEDHSRKDLVSLIRKAGHEVVYESSKGDFAKALQNPGDLVVIAGGDGTFRKVALKLCGVTVPMTILPMGTANNISTSLGITGEPKKLIAGWAKAKRRKLSVGQANSPWSKDFFVEGVGLGLFTRLMSILDAVDGEAKVEFSTAEDEVNRNLTSLVVLLSEFPAMTLNLKLDGKEMSGSFLFMEIMNIKYAGPSLLIAPDADPRDSYLDCVLLDFADREGFAEYLTSQMSGKNGPAPVKIIKARNIEFQWEGQPIHVDDLIWTKGITVPAPPQQLEIKLSDYSLEILVP
jgi:diacylglycerol kinase family enzyme